MKRSLAAASAALLISATAALAASDNEGFDGAHCQFISEAGASGRSGQVRPLAIRNWQNQIAANCPEFSNKWWRAKSRYITCQTVRNREVCTAGAAPARKLFGWLSGR